MRAYLFEIDLFANEEIILPSVPSFGAIVRRLRDRFSSLSWFYERSEPVIDYRNCARDAVRVKTVRADIRYQSAYRRNSTRECQDMSGFTGSIEFRGPLAPYTQLLQFGQYLHRGKATVFGYGWYDLQL
ncbi:MAG: CRISPR system precrRNA processing endoribonuclease RAMP protein Cas6 [Spirochaetes bacterium]|nr:CRISPR system precrRNA processing endoribonuclease RAMP protein Cas6 [Spirochaetota bacterium]